MQTRKFFSKKDQNIIQKEALACEQSGTLTEPVLDLVRRKKLFHLAVPKELGGAQKTVPELMNIFEEASVLDGSFGWVVTLGAGAGIFGAYMDQTFAENVFSNPNVFITGSGYPAGSAIPDGDFYTVNGKWKYASGTPHATLFTASCKVYKGNNDKPGIKVMAFFPNEVQKLKTWNSYGLKATASYDFEVNRARVPHHRTFFMASQPKYESHILYRFPFDAFASATLASSMMGIARGFIDHANHLFENKSSTDDQKTGFEVVQSARHEIGQRKIKLHNAVEAVWKKCKTEVNITNEDVEMINQAAKKLAGVCRQRCFHLYNLCGMQILPETSAINRSWRDLMTAGQHALLR